MFTATLVRSASSHEMLIAFVLQRHLGTGGADPEPDPDLITSVVGGAVLLLQTPAL